MQISRRPISREWNDWSLFPERAEFLDTVVTCATKLAPTLLAPEPHHAIELPPLEGDELPDVAGKSILHLHCHIGLDTMAWANRGAIVTGVDVSEHTIAFAQLLSDQFEIPASFLCADLEDLPTMLSGRFDIICTAHGLLETLPDLRPWAEAIAHFLKPGGISTIVPNRLARRMVATLHPPVLYPELMTPGRAALPTGGHAPSEQSTGIVVADAPTSSTFYGNSPYTISDVFRALMTAGLRIDLPPEFPHRTRASEH